MQVHSLDGMLLGNISHSVPDAKQERKPRFSWLKIRWEEILFPYKLLKAMATPNSVSHLTRQHLNSLVD